MSYRRRTTKGSKTLTLHGAPHTDFTILLPQRASSFSLRLRERHSELVLEYVQYEADEGDDASVGQLQRIGRTLQKELVDLESFRTSKLNRLRITSAVQPSTFAGEKAALLRFFQ